MFPGLEGAVRAFSTESVRVGSLSRPQRHAGTSPQGSMRCSSGEMARSPLRHTSHSQHPVERHGRGPRGRSPVVLATFDEKVVGGDKDARRRRGATRGCRQHEGAHGTGSRARPCGTQARGMRAAVIHGVVTSRRRPETTARSPVRLEVGKRSSSSLPGAYASHAAAVPLHVSGVTFMRQATCGWQKARGFQLKL